MMTSVKVETRSTHLLTIKRIRDTTTSILSPRWRYPSLCFVDGPIHVTIEYSVSRADTCIEMSGESDVLKRVLIYGTRVKNREIPI
jgi:hypothetical protein